MKHDNGPGSHITDEHIDGLVQNLQQRKKARQSLADVPDLRLADDIRRAYQDETDQDQLSLEQVFTRLVEGQATARPKIISLSKIDQQQERISAVQNNTFQTFSQRKPGWKRRLSVFAAILCMMVLIGGFLAIFNAERASHTTGVGSQIEVTPTPQPTGSPASHAIQKALLTAADTGNSEGIGPGLAGLTGATQFSVGQKFWLFFIVNDNGGGTVAVKWYTNGSLYSSSSQYIPSVPVSSSRGGIPPTPGPGRTPTPAPTTSVPSTPTPTASVPVESNFSVTYNRPAQGKVELYWHGQLAMTLLFVVKSEA